MNNLRVDQLANRQLGQYTLRELIGTGGMSAVYRAHQASLDREVAVKVLATELADDPDYRQRFALEARTAASLEHKHIVPVYDYGTTHGLIFVVMRLLTGGTLAQRLAIAIRRGRTLPSPGDMVQLIEAIGSALDYAHGRGVIHRDIKPSNVMFDALGTPYVVDFGIARILNTNLELTMTGTTIGTPNYMAPEQWRDQPLTPAVDQYALAILVFNALTGKLPFQATTSHAVMYKHLHEVPPPIHEVRASLPAALSPVLQKAMAKHPHNRYPTISAFAEAFRAACDDLHTTDFFSFAIQPISLPEELTPSSSARSAAPGSFSQQVVLADPKPIPPPPDLPESAGSGGAMPFEPPRLPEDSWLGNTMPGPASAGAPPAVTTGPAPAVVGRPTAPQPRTRWEQPPARPRTSGDGSAARWVGMALATVLILVFFVLAFILIIRTLNSRAPVAQVDAPPTATTALQPTPAATTAPFVVAPPTALPTIAPPASNPAGGTAITPAITPANAARVQAAGTIFSQSETPVRMIAVSPQGMLASAHGDGLVRLWRNGFAGTAITLSGHQGVVYTVAFSPNSALLASGGEDGAIRLWRTTDGALAALLSGHEGLVRDLAFSPDGQILASAGEDGTVRLWNTTTGAQRLTLAGGEDLRMLAVAFSPDGRLLATGDSAGLIRLWNPDNGQSRRSLPGHTGSVRSLAFSPDGSLLASSSTDDTIHVWDVASGMTLQILVGHGRDVWKVVFSPDGRLLASGGRDNNARLWDVTTGNLLNTLSGHAGWVLGVAFTPDGSGIITGGGDGQIRLWQPAG
ncbi:MAG: hypothetical protein Kow0077_02760 [Anaerolineae bacterium]